jgi:regulator of CtrA degradation
MAGPITINPHIIDALYGEAMLLADEVRNASDMSGKIGQLSENANLARIAFSCEALRATTRMMHTIAWLLNQRAYFNGELSEFQLRRYGHLPQDRAAADGSNLPMLPPPFRELVHRTQQFHARVARLDMAWRDGFSTRPDAAIQQLRDRLGQAIRYI